MKTYAVTYRYSVSPEEQAEVRPAHRAFLVDLMDKGIMLAAGPLGNFVGGLLIFKATDEAELAALLDNDPYDIAGFIGERAIEEWNPVFGPFN